MASIPVPAQPHVPAWKKLGLKLKYVKDDPTPLETSSIPVTANDKKRKHTFDTVTEATTTAPDVPTTKPSKKIKKSHSKPTTASTNQGGGTPNDAATLKTALTPSSEALLSKSSPSPSTPALPKRKSVSFTPETKSVDGQSSKDLYAHWLATQKAEDPSFEPPKALTALKPVTPAPSSTDADTHNPSQKSKQLKKPKSKTKTKGQINTATPDSKKDISRSQTHPALEYLTTFTTSSSTWKFSKNHQTYLLKHLFDLDILPASYNPPLRTYLSGLKGASARQRIRESAVKVRQEDEMWLSDLLAAEIGSDERDRKRKRDEYERAWKREEERLKDMEEEKERDGEKKTFNGVEMSEWEWRVTKRRRAEEVLWGVGEVEALETLPALNGRMGNGRTNNANTALQTQVNGGAGQGRQANGGAIANGKRKRVRKRRTTGVPDDESSSSSSSSESSSEEEETTSGHAVTTKAPDSKMDSDSGPSSSDSDSDSASGSSSSSESESESNSD